MNFKQIIEKLKQNPDNIATVECVKCYGVLHMKLQPDTRKLKLWCDGNCGINTIV